MAALAAALAATPLAAQTGLRWATAIPRSAALIGLIFFGASIASTLVMPRNAAIVRRIPPSSERLPSGVLLIAVAWCIAAVWQLPPLATWFQDNAVAVRALVGTGPDPLGLNLVPATVAYALPALTALALTGFVLGAVLVVACRPAVAFRVTAACAVLQGALVAGEYLVRVDTARVLDGLLTALQPHGVPTARVSAWLTGNDATAPVVEPPLRGGMSRSVTTCGR